MLNSQQPGEDSVKRCPWSKLEISEKDSTINPNMIIKLYEYFEQNPAGLLLLPATSNKQQQFFEDIYNQVTESAGCQQIPNLISKAFKFDSLEEYLQLKNDQRFLFREFKICESCYECIKKMLFYQSDELVRARTFKSVK